ncbi:hypothetical protein [Domibacillus iocasae]|uniref:Uncharacterized protein n=1 Tax=Domibacillus iocasae TaxID=1714016 RepID=A0A1E7DRV8_9BACI|nr:hypothetical protein [Domibacillus iocasae]OES45822.1 hypothetical protein BA724_03190 [Domibacillus iocasae]
MAKYSVLFTFDKENYKRLEIEGENEGEILKMLTTSEWYTSEDHQAVNMGNVTSIHFTKPAKISNRSPW